MIKTLRIRPLAYTMGLSMLGIAVVAPDVADDYDFDAIAAAQAWASLATATMGAVSEVVLARGHVLDPIVETSWLST